MRRVDLLIKGESKDINTLLQERLERCNIQLERVITYDRPRMLFTQDIRGLHSLYLDKHPIFQYLLNEVKKWNELVQEHQKTKIEISHSDQKNVLYRLLTENLRQIFNTKDKLVQQEFLKDVEKWYVGQLSIYEQKAVKPEVFNRQTNLYNYDDDEQDEDAKPKDLYENNNRSKHVDLDPPEDRLKEFQRKILQTPSVTTRPGTSEWKISRPVTQMTDARPGQADFRPGTTGTNQPRILSTADSGRPFTGLASIQEGGGGRSRGRQSEEQLPKLINNWSYNDFKPFGLFTAQTFTQYQNSKNQKQKDGLQSDNKQLKEAMDENEKVDDEAESPVAGQQENAEEEDNNDGDEAPIEQQNQDEIKKEKVNMRPDHKPYRNDNQTQQAYQENPEWLKYQEFRSIYHQYHPTENIAEVRLEALWYKNRNKLLAERRENEELVKMVQDWAVNRGRIEEEINKKTEMMIYGSNFQQIGQQNENKKRFIKKVVSQQDFAKSKLLTKAKFIDDQKFNNYQQIKQLSQQEKEAICQQSQLAQQKQSNVLNKQASQVSLDTQQQQAQGQGPDNLSPAKVSLESKASIASVQEWQKPATTSGRIQNQQSIPEEDTQGLTQEIPPEFLDLSGTEPPKRQEEHVDNPNNKFIDLEQDIKKQKILRIRQLKNAILYNGYTKKDDIDEQEILRRKESSLSIYGKKSNIQYRPFSTIYKKFSINELKKDQLREIQRIKTGFSKAGIHCSMQTLTSSLLPAEDLLPSKLNNIPQCGSMLMINPFNIVKKKKGKKKK